MRNGEHVLEVFGGRWGGWRLDPTRIGPQSTIISAGISNDTTFDSAILARFPEARVVCIDPTLEGVRTATALSKKYQGRVDIIDRALSMPGCSSVRLGGPASSKLTATDKDRTYQTITLSEVLGRYANISVLKMDIEGSEYEILPELIDDSIPQICLEWHHWLSPGTLSIQDTVDAIRYIESLGYFEIERVTNESWRVLQHSLFMKKSLLP